mmetsp:Transcript_39360/g.93275  ORF Transcript_39360/g.93275 Transcript_39360/m.93275 type:complete len:189 (+) Transcript_39360:578-1144(+)
MHQPPPAPLPSVPPFPKGGGRGFGRGPHWQGPRQHGAGGERRAGFAPGRDSDADAKRRRLDGGYGRRENGGPPGRFPSRPHPPGHVYGRQGGPPPAYMGNTGGLPPRGPGAGRGGGGWGGGLASSGYAPRFVPASGSDAPRGPQPGFGGAKPPGAPPPTGSGRAGSDAKDKKAPGPPPPIPHWKDSRR